MGHYLVSLEKVLDGGIKPSILTKGSYASQDTNLAVVTSFPCFVPAGEEHQRSSTRHRDRTPDTKGRFSPPVSCITKPAYRVQVSHVTVTYFTWDRKGSGRRGRDKPDIERATTEGQRGCADDKRTGRSVGSKGAVDNEHSGDAEEQRRVLLAQQQLI